MMYGRNPKKIRRPKSENHFIDAVKPSSVVLFCFLLLVAAASAPAEETLNSLAERFSKHIAVLPTMPGENALQTPPGRALRALELTRHVVCLSPDQFVDTNYFDPKRFPVTLYFGGETYLQTVRQPSDGDQALRNYLGAGGTLLLLPNGPFPMYYNREGKPVNGAAMLGLQIGAFGFESKPAGRTLLFHANTNLDGFRFPTPVLPYPPETVADQRWRSCTASVTPGARYRSILTLRDERGQSYGDGVALVEHTQGPLAGGRILHVWDSLLADVPLRNAVVGEALRYALAQAPPPRSWATAERTGSSNRLATAVWSLETAASFFKTLSEACDDPADPPGHWERTAGQWKIEGGNLVGQDCVGNLYESKGLSHGDASWHDYIFSVRFKVESRGSDWRDGPWFGLRSRPDGDGYHLTFTDRECQLHKIIYGQSTSHVNCLARAPWKADAGWHALRVELRGHHLSATLDGQPLFQVTDNAHLYLPSLRCGGIVLAARKASVSNGSTVVRFDEVRVKLLRERE